MPNLINRLAENALGAFYVDDTCIDCGLCRENAPAFFRLHEELGLSIVYRQPVTPGEIALAQDAMIDCPTNSIGNDG